MKIGITVDPETLNATLAAIGGLGATAKAATRRAIGAGASALRKLMREYVRSGGQGWKSLHPIGAAVSSGGTTQGTNLKQLGLKMFIGGASNAKIRNEVLKIARKEMQGATRGFLGKLENVFRFEMSPSNREPSAEVGVLEKYAGAKGRYLFEKFQEGGDLGTAFRKQQFKQPSMLRFWGALGIHLRRNTRLKQPARPIVMPVWEKNKTAIETIISNKFEERMINPK